MESKAQPEFSGLPSCRGYIVHAYADKRRDRIYILGRLENGSSFAVVENQWRPSLHIYQRDLESCRRLLDGLHFEIRSTEIESFEGEEKLPELKFPGYLARDAAAARLEEAGIISPDGDQKPAEAFLTEQGIRGAVQIEGSSQQGRLVDLIFQNPVLAAPENFSSLNVPLRLCSVDIETDVKTGIILAIGISVSVWDNIKNKRSMVRVLMPGIIPEHDESADNIFFHHDEKSLLQAFLKDIRDTDPDVLTGWNILDFDYPHLAERCAFHRIPFVLGRSREEAKFFPGQGSNDSWTERRRSATALVPGRQVMDALRIVRSSPRKFSGYTLENVAQAVLGLSKTVSSAGDQKIRDLEKLYNENKRLFGEYCLRDAELVLEILEQTKLFRLSLERASLTGVSLDKAWTSVVSFERIYGLELRARKISPPPKTGEQSVSGAAGGTVLDPVTGIFSNVGVFDFRSLYPTIILSFNIDPWAHARATALGLPLDKIIKAPNGAIFSREPGILPRLIESYFAARRKALDAGDEEASYVYKILMNSFYGVLGTASCRYGRTELAGAITSFARKWLLYSRDWFSEKGYRVLYGDTDSLFVESLLGDNASYQHFLDWGNGLARELNLCLVSKIENEYDLESRVELRFEKTYRRFMIPPLRNFHNNENRGRAKGYGGWILDTEGNLKIEVKGMEAVRSDATPLARRIQTELLELVFKGGGEKELRAYFSGIIKKLRLGLLDNELIYRKRLSRAPENYTASTPPQVKAARALGWKNRRGTVEYVWTLSGPEPTALPHAGLDYNHYADSQVLPVALSIAAAAGWDTGLFPQNKKDFFKNGQTEFEF